MTRTAAEQLRTAIWLVAQFEHQIAEHDNDGSHADRIDGLREGLAKWQATEVELRAQIGGAQ